MLGTILPDLLWAIAEVDFLLSEQVVSVGLTHLGDVDTTVETYRAQHVSGRNLRNASHRYHGQGAAGASSSDS